METNEKRNVPDDDVIDLREIFFAIKRKIFLIIAVGLLGGCLYGAYTAFLIDPVYTSTASILVLSKETTLTSIADLQLGSQLAADYQVLIKSTSVMEDVIDALDLEMTPEALRASITINNPVDTRILEVSVVNTDGELAKKITDKVVEVSSEYIGDKMEVVPPKIIEVGKIATIRTSPSVKKNAEIGFLLGFVACAAIVVVLTIMDDTIKTEEDIEKYLGISVLAKVPDRKDFVNVKSKKNKKKSHR